MNMIISCNIASWQSRSVCLDYLVSEYSMQSQFYSIMLDETVIDPKY